MLTLTNFIIFMNLVFSVKSSCSSVHKPPCPSKYFQRECSIVRNSTIYSSVECVPEAEDNQWQYWVIVAIVVAAIIVCIVIWRFTRELPCCIKCKDSIRHEKNRVIARWCVGHICKCQCCVKCCEPYTRPTVNEIREEREKASEDWVNLHIGYHEHFDNASHSESHHHHSHHFHERVGPAENPDDERIHHTVVSNTAKDNETIGKPLEEAAENSIVLAS